MARRRGPWSRTGRGRSERDGRFLAVVVGVAAGAFYVTLNWPLSADAAAEAPPAEQAGAAEALPRPRGELECRVAWVSDGDTFGCRGGRRIRLHAVAAREKDNTCRPGHPCPAAPAEAAKAELERLVLRHALTCQPIGRDRDRVTAICWTPAGEEVNCAMVRSGKVALWPRYARLHPLCRP